MYRIISEQNLIQYSIFLDGFVIGKEAGAQSATVDGCGCLWQFRPFQGTNSSVPDPPLWWAGSISLSRLVLSVQGFVFCLHSSMASALLFMKIFLLCGSRCFTYSSESHAHCLRMTSNFVYSCLSFLSVGIAGMCHCAMILGCCRSNLGLGAR